MGFKREAAASKYVSAIILFGITIWIYSAFSITTTPDFFIFSTLLLFLFITENFPIPIWKGLSALSFPLFYTIELLYGLGITIIVLGGMVCLVHALNKRPFRIVLFNPAQLMLSFFGAVHIADFLLFSVKTWLSPFGYAEIRMILVAGLFYILNNLIVDTLLIIRPQSYPLKMWKTKTISESLVTLLSIAYMTLMFLLGSQNRGVVDVFSYIFFFSPLVALALISSFIARLNQERNRLKALYKISTTLNAHLPSKDWLQEAELPFLEFLGTDAVLLFLYDGNSWKQAYQNGMLSSDEGIYSEFFDQLESKPSMHVCNKKNENNKWGFTFFPESIKSVMIAPLKTEEEILGVLLTGRTRTHAFSAVDTQSMSTLANQLTVAWKTKLLISEREKRILLEERNRIAREIHDGIAQTLAGSVMQLESAQRVFTKKPERTKQLVAVSTEKLRGSLKELRESIYALRPYLTERIGLHQAIKAKIQSVEEEGHTIQIHFQVRGTPCRLSQMVEKVIFDIFQESLQNVLKHAKAAKVTIILSYSSDQVTFRIKDDGVGFSLYESMIKARQEPHYGILNMNEQSDTLGASLHIDSAKGKGTEIKLQIPHLETKEANIP
ncbi:GAF domain-containing sensor histidine kinase [Fictibacillus phosphorivorans]|uniref:GAF domain-containing sensor histidine kinase n=1 Tax=Fictibacillus phosphorivorans TaxID=1221500 RepID=UPI00203F1791|nr:GAF domain-containing sensor histidine kinase [Fictibacillus phosphorivorans]MCM3718650.1 GAF domain-containing sensor histidine kinase [Fictibacillus phosphorivorans]MCM3776273.1 GAF domain-containing sensor histidine kinase [Fictibacillus phosphorivorans]